MLPVKSRKVYVSCYLDNYIMSYDHQSVRVISQSFVNLQPCMCFPGRETHITRDICFTVRGTHITRDMCFPGRGTHITSDMCFLGRGTHIARDISFPGRGKHITSRGVARGGPGVPVTPPW